VSLAIALATGAILGAAAATAITWRHLTLRYDLASYHRLELEVRDVRALHQTADSNYRLARRLGRALDAADALYRQQVGDLLDRLAHQPRHLTRPAYGPGSIIRTYGHRRTAA